MRQLPSHVNTMDGSPHSILAYFKRMQEPATSRHVLATSRFIFCNRLFSWRQSAEYQMTVHDERVLIGTALNRIQHLNRCAE